MVRSDIPVMEEFEREEQVHGQTWNALHGGYFADPEIARPLVQKILQLCRACDPRIVVDLGGGTGYVLSQLRAAGVGDDVTLVDLDSSRPQLAVARRAGLACLCGAVDTFQRQDVGPEDSRFLFVMRSALHYFGRERLSDVLRHVRAQARPGEFFVHQTASFRDPRDADCLNTLYRRMHTKKWYPTVDVLSECLAETGWNVLEVLPAAPLTLTPDDLARRYELNPRTLADIHDRLSRDFHDRHTAFESGDSGFRAFLHYWIYVCRAATSA